jgi:hypothetical protein
MHKHYINEMIEINNYIEQSIRHLYNIKQSIKDGKLFDAMDSIILIEHKLNSATFKSDGIARNLETDEDNHKDTRRFIIEHLEESSSELMDLSFTDDLELVNMFIRSIYYQNVRVNHLDLISDGHILEHLKGIAKSNLTNQ